MVNTHMQVETEIDVSLPMAMAVWEKWLHEGIDAFHAGDVKVAITSFSQAVSESAQYHPLYHFLESGLQTDVGAIYLRDGEKDEASQHFNRAVFLDHNNETAKAALIGMDVSALPPYPMLELTKALPSDPSSSLPNLRATFLAAKRESDQKALTMLMRAIDVCENTHAAYHKAAALPWLWRARAFRAQGERELAKNDARRGLDLDRTNPDLMGLSAL